MRNDPRRDIIHNFLLPTLLFAALGGMTWAVRGCSGYGAVNGCVFAGVTWGAAWWFIARDPAAGQSRRYASGWIVLALAVGIGLSGGRGWMQWPSFFRGELLIDAQAGKFVPISRGYGFLWLFIAGVPWAGIGACMLAWCGSARPLRARDWLLRIGCGIGAAYAALQLFHAYPEIFLPFYKTMQAQYLDAITHPETTAFPNLRRLYGDNRLAIMHLGIYLGFLAYEIGRRDGKNVVLIATVGILNGLGWSLCQNWQWAQNLWPNWNFNFWRCWESSGGISIGIAYGVAYYLVNRPDSNEAMQARWQNARPSLERFGLYFGLLLGLGLSIKNGLRGWANIYIGNEDYWSRILTLIIGPLMLLGLLFLLRQLWRRPLPSPPQGDVFPRAYGIIWLVLIVQNILAQLVTGPHNNFSENAFCVYYAALFILSAAIVRHYHRLKTIVV